MAARRLTDEEIIEALESLLDWRFIDERLVASFRFQDFKEAFAFMTRVAHHAEELNHHPEWSNVYNRVDVGLTTHDSGGVTQNDMDLAKIMSDLARAS